MIVVHLNELVKVDGVEVKDATQMVSENEVVTELHHPLDVVGIMLLEQEEQLGLDSGLIIVFLLVLDELDGYKLLVLVIQALDDLTEGALTDDLDQLEPVGDMVPFLNSVVPLFVVKAIIYKSFQLCRLDLGRVVCEVVEVLILIHLSPLKVCEVLACDLLRLGSLGVDWELNRLQHGIVDGQLLPF